MLFDVGLIGNSRPTHSLLGPSYATNAIDECHPPHGFVLEADRGTSPERNHIPLADFCTKFDVTKGMPQMRGIRPFRNSSLEVRKHAESRRGTTQARTSAAPSRL